MSDSSVIRSLQNAIDQVRETCTGTEYKALLAACDAADSAAEKALGQPDDTAEDKRTPNQPKDLKAAAQSARRMFAGMRESASQPK